MRSIEVVAVALTVATLAGVGPALAQRAIAHPVLRPVADPALAPPTRTPPPPSPSPSPSPSRSNMAAPEVRR